MEEIIDKVNKKDKIIGKTTKKQSHVDGSMHRVVAIFVIKDDQILINKRHDNGLLDHSVGGHVREKETYKQAATREAKEEIGLSINKKSLKLIGHFFYDETPRTKNLKHWFTVYKVNAPQNFKPKPQKGEVVSLEFRDIKSIQKKMKKNPKQFAFGFLGTMNEYIKYFDKSTAPIPMK